ncbi:MAG TPA: 16S rRNA (uracil(1498)-N(3))-methyltransferase [Chiayiivirga sp.]|nr:16S rRNA (uracil(1498)-N(3))-methyltransferase [Chiayiivirga sp.]
MRLTRCAVDLPLAEGTCVALPESVTAHLLRVLRLGDGARVVLFNGDGHDYEAELIAVGKHTANARVMRVHALANESPLTLVLVQAVARGEKMDWVLQKATELGVRAIIPVITERCEVRLDAERGDKRHQHWLGVIASACGQSGRAKIPALSRAMKVETWLDQPAMAGMDAVPQDPRQRLPIFHLDPDAGSTLASAATRLNRGGCFVIGPEGGLGERDLARLTAAGSTGLRLGPRILRTETAGLALLAALQATFGDL